MKIINGIKNLQPQPKESIATIGIFDGIHRGHQKIINRVVETAIKKNWQSILITFDRHPNAVLRPENEPALLTPLPEKVVILERLGVDLLLLLTFTKDFAQLKPVDFITEVLLPLRIKRLIIGEDFRFGKNREGDIDLLRKYGQTYHFEIEVQPPVQVDGEIISSSLIRNLLQKGNIEKAKQLLGRFPSIKGRVIKGHSRGKSLGFPSANIKIPAKICLPKRGVYAGLIRFNEEEKKCIINLGYAPTFSKENELRLEAHVLNFKGDLYGKEVEIEFRRWLRDEITFSDKEDLIKQLRKDAKKAEVVLR